MVGGITITGITRPVEKTADWTYYHSLDFAQTTSWDEFEDLLASLGHRAADRRPVPAGPAFVVGPGQALVARRPVPVGADQHGVWRGDRADVPAAPTPRRGSAATETDSIGPRSIGRLSPRPPRSRRTGRASWSNA